MKKVKLAIFTVALLLMYAVAAQAAVVVVPELKATPANSHIFRVTGADFNASSAIKLQLLNGTDMLHNFTESIATDSAGAFNAVVVAPTSLAGTYNLTATSQTETGAYNTTATIKVTLPDMTGPQGETGEEGHQGEVGPQGVKGDTGEIANTDAQSAVAGLSIILSIIALILALFYKKK